MNSRIETIEKIREADLNNYRKFTNESEALINQAMDKLQETQMNLNAKILTLQDEKGDLLRGPMSKQELLASVLESYRKGRSDIIAYLKNHLSAAHKGHVFPFDTYTLRKEFDQKEGAHRLLFLILQESDINNVINEMDEIGMPALEKTKRIAAIDKEIYKLMNELKNILKAIDGQV